MKKLFLVILLQLITLQSTFAQWGFNISKEQELKEWMNESARAGEFYSKQIPIVENILVNLRENPKDHDLNFNLAVELHMGLKRVFKTELDPLNYQESTKNIKTAVRFLYMFHSNGSSETNRKYLMRGMFNNDIGFYPIGINYLKRAMEVEEEGSEYWMMAADQYLFSCLKMDSVYELDKKLTTYSKFQNYVNQSKDKYYSDRLQMYIPYFEPKL